MFFHGTPSVACKAELERMHVLHALPALRFRRERQGFVVSLRLGSFSDITSLQQKYVPTLSRKLTLRL